jgi:methylphosphotriester-DNA--protein-cysteine methyltransferase
MENIIDFPAAADRASHRRRPYRQRGSKNKHTLVFRSYDLIVQSDEAALVRDVCFDVDRAESKLRRIKQRLKNVLVESAAKVQLLTAAETKLTAAIVAALLSTSAQS